MRIRVLFFASYSDITQTQTRDLDLPIGATLRDCVDRIKEQHPGLAAALPTGRFAVNEDFADEDCDLHDGDNVAFMPPMSGG